MSGEKNKPSLNNGVVVAHQTTTFSGPLPPPEALAQYEEVLPGLADRIVKMAEGQSEHRKRLESRLVWFDGIRSSVGLFFGFAIAVCGIIVGAWLISRGKSITGLASLVVPLGVIVGAFIYQKREETKKGE